METQKASLRELIGQLVLQLEQLISAHLRLARQELADDGKRLATRSIGVVLGGILALLGVTFFGLSGYQFFLLWLPGWGAALAVAFIYLIGGAALAFLSVRRLTKTNLSVERTLEETKETITWLTQKR